MEETGDQLLDVLAGAELPVLLLVDEAPILVNRLLKGSDYLERTEDCYQFVSRLLRDWWKARYEFGYTPVAKRGV